MVESQFSRESQNISRQQLQDLVRSQVQTLLEQENFQGAKSLLIPVQPVDIARVIEELPEAMQAIAFRLLSKDEAIEVYEYLDSSIQQVLIEDFKRQDVLDIVDKMSPDDRARLFDELPAKVVRQLLEQLSPQERESTALLLGYTPSTAGRIMTPEYIALKENMTVNLAFERIRQLAPSMETIYYLYVTDRDRHLVGILSLRDLVTAQPEQTIGAVMTREVVFVNTDTDQEEVVQLIQHYDFVAVPVVDRDRRLVGIITVDDVIDVLQEETTEDIYTLGGVQSGGDNYFQTNLLTVARKRVGWLLILLLTNTATSAVIRDQEDVLEQVVALAAFIPLLIDTGGNVGAQSSTVVIRGLNTGDVRLSRTLQIVRREAIAGLMLGLMLGIVVTVWAYFLQGDMGVAVSVGLSLLCITLIASVAGSGLPFLFNSFGLDPALMSAPFITTAVDVLGVFIYLSLARLILGL
ncbi:magnesium transporter [Desertifilum sp. FACHB-1129]|uniref:Magnesium transporter MgtE n=1 Tax=Desertifilum tharense IPPAS B-1220 TaxID=1781255 RepID=A0A1E5QMA4_9CYAN|nr:magnesium transporter [Desertifilum tharense]MBD2313695.1 magnesium transporter [Desertifilum sp. FACHB-1129]MBD2324989.1 magnesium transporter [Desertifilum sp. FACHB-866]MBD2335128.1 magnesium transporter [Desertifilum sp. FACHB-868]MDA0213367.1 magnesium transporter [Cyanobacteria bacterium FC1]OEJ75724.1 magnesium transporter [Desertifilum tharense IPPAS B-1220]